MTDLDRELADRLGRLAAAVPVRSAQLDPVHAGAVAARQRVRMAWLTPLVALVVLALLATLLGVGALNVANGPISSTTRAGDFELTITSAKARYEVDEPIEIAATLTYAGPEASARITHASSPMVFGIEEPVHGLLLNGVWAESCGSSSLDRGVGVRQDFVKSFGTLGPIGPEAQAFGTDPVLRLPEGTWHPWVAAEFSLGGCGDATVSMKATLAIDVGPSDASVTADPTATAAAADRTHSSATLGDFELRLAASKETFSSSEPLDVVASLIYRGPEDHVRIGYVTWGPIEFSMVAPGVVLAGRGRSTCDEVDLQRDSPMTEALVDLETGQPFAVRHGLRSVTATATFAVGGCSSAMSSVDTLVDIVVSDGPDDIPLRTDEAQDGGACLLLINGGKLVRSDSGFGVINGLGERREVVWPQGYSAREDPGDAVLLGAAGEVIAREGERVQFDAWTPPEGPLRPCGPVERWPSETPIAAAPVVASDTQGPYTLELRSAQAVYHVSDVIDVSGAFTYAGTSTIDVQGFKVLVFSVREPVDGVDLSGLVTMDCNFATLEPGEKIVSPFVKRGGVSGSDPDLERKLAYLQDPVFRLPVGTWHISVRGSFWEDRCGGDREIQLSTTIEIEVVPD